jgi:hypothetical protein
VNAWVVSRGVHAENSQICEIGADLRVHAVSKRAGCKKIYVKAAQRCPPRPPPHPPPPQDWRLPASSLARGIQISAITGCQVPVVDEVPVATSRHQTPD